MGNSNKGKEILVWVLIAVGLGAVVFGMYGAATQSGKTNGDGSVLVSPVVAEDRTKGSANAKVELVEYSDFECPACRYFYGMVKQLEAEKGNAVRVTYRHFPLQQHRYALVTAQAAEAAELQGKFWEMHDMLFEKQEEWSKSADIQQSLIGYATALGLDAERFVVDIQKKEIADKIDRDRALGAEQKIQGTPTFFLNGTLVQFRSYEDLKQLVEVELNK